MDAEDTNPCTGGRALNLKAEWLGKLVEDFRGPRDLQSALAKCDVGAQTAATELECLPHLYVLDGHILSSRTRKLHSSDWQVCHCCKR